MKPYTENDRVKLQKHLSVIRKIAGWTAEDLGKLIGVTKQTISNIETQRTSLTKLQYIAIRAVIDNEIVATPENTALAQVVKVLLDSNEKSEEDAIRNAAVETYVAKAKADGLTGKAFSLGLSVLLTALGTVISETLLNKSTDTKLSSILPESEWSSIVKKDTWGGK